MPHVATGGPGTLQGMGSWHRSGLERQKEPFTLSLYPSGEPQSLGATPGHFPPHRQDMKTPSDHAACQWEDCVSHFKSPPGSVCPLPASASTKPGGLGMSLNISPESPWASTPGHAQEAPE